MDVRDARPEDAGPVADLAGVEAGVAERLVRERRVRVACTGENGDPVGFVAYEATADAVHVTRLVGDADVAAALLEEPVTFARAEGLDVEAVVPERETGALAAVADAGFEAVGDGPRFEGAATTRYRLAVDEDV